MKKVLSFILSVILIVSVLPFGAITVSAATSGTTGDCTWTLDGTVLTISGNGNMADYDYWAKFDHWGTSITEVIIEDGVTSIGSYAFSDCTGLTSVTIGNSVTSISSTALSGCTGLTSFTVGEENQNYSSLDGVLFNKDKTELIQYPIGNTRTSYIILDSVTSIGKYAFRYCTKLTSVTIGNSVTSIGEYAFYDCDSLTSVTIGNSVISIGEHAFYDCDSLISVTIGNSVISIGEYVFYDCDSLTSVTIGNSVTSIGSHAFMLCDSLTSITIPDSVTSIGNSAFDSCTGLTSITIPDSVTSIGRDAFMFCDSLSSVYITDISAWCNIFFGNYSSNPLYCADNLYLNNQLVTDVVIPQGVTIIPPYAFSCSNLRSIAIPDSIKSISYSAFRNCTGLDNVYITDIAAWCNISFYTSSYNESKLSLLYYADNLYLNNQLVIDVVIPQGVTKIPLYAFSCLSLKSITIPDSVTSIWEYAFDNCISLKDIWYTGDNKINISIGSYNTPLNTATWHYNTCSNDTHTYGGECDSTCNNCEWQRIVTTSHIYDNGCDADCNACGLIRVTADHIYDNDCDKACNVCGVTRVTDHKYDNNCDTNCNICNEARDVEEHVYDNACDTDCNVCGEKREITHDFEWVNDVEASCGMYGIKHEECKVCHTKQKEFTIIPANKNHSYDNDCDVDCNVCFEIREITHDYKWIIDEPNNCGVDGKKHEECTVCHIKRNENTKIDATGKHSYDNSCDAECNVCFKTREITHDYEWVIDEANNCGVDGKKHEECTVCHAKQNENTKIDATGKHSYDNDCDAECNVCNEIRIIIHDYEWVIEKQFNCGEYGIKHEECTVCHAKRNEYTFIPATQNHVYDNDIDKECNVCKNVRVITFSGWFEENGKWYYYENGNMVKDDWREDSIGWVYLGSDGAMLTNAWCTDSSGWCYVGPDGYAVTNCWKQDSIGWIWLNDSGSMTKSSWLYDNGNWYWLDENGYMAHDTWMQDSNGWVYLGSDGAMLTNSWCTDSSGWCYVGADGYAVTNCWMQDSIGWIWLNDSGSMTKNSWLYDNGNWYYLNSDGYMVTGWQLINGTWYNFNSSGIWVA